MSKKADEREVSELSERMLQVLESQRHLGGDAYPPTLRRLAELCGVSPEHAHVLKAAAKKVFTAKATATEKKGRQPVLDSPVYLKEDVPATRGKRASPGKKGDDEVTELSERMLRILVSQRDSGGTAYPPTLRRLAELCGETTSGDRILKAVGKKLFNAKAVVTEKVGRKPSSDSPVYLKEDAPAKKTERVAPGGKGDGGIAELAEKMLLVLVSQRQLGGEAYPPTLRRLAELCEVNGSDARIPKAAGREPMAERAIVAANVRGKPSLDAPILLKEDVEDGKVAILPALLGFALRGAATTGKARTEAFTTTELKKRLVPSLQAPFGDAIERGIEREALPPDVAWVLIKGNPHLFLVENLRPEASRRDPPAQARPARPRSGPDGLPAVAARTMRAFAEAFREEFERIDRRNGATNFVKLSDLRRALSDYDRERFDAGLRQLRLDGEFSLDSHEGLLKPLTPEERDAAIPEAGSLLVYVSRT